MARNHAAGTGMSSVDAPARNSSSTPERPASNAVSRSPVSIGRNPKTSRKKSAARAMSAT